jgi:hypothetical protein
MLDIEHFSTVGRAKTSRNKCCLIEEVYVKTTLMSKGPGRIERAIEALFKAKPNDAFSTVELCDHVYAGINRVERKHRVAVTRAANKVCARMPDWGTYQSWRRGAELIFHNRASIMSYALARKKADAWEWDTDKSIRADLEPGGSDHHLIVEGGSWWLHVKLHIADRDGDRSERAEALRREYDEVRASYNLPPQYTGR